MDHPPLSVWPPSLASSSYSCPLSSNMELWLIAEERAEEILLSIRPTILSEEQRKEAIEGVQILLRGYYGAKVIPFGSVPLRTYLPDGDIDLTIICRPGEEEECTKGVANFLRARQKEEELQIRDIIYICAQVKIVKFSWKNIPIDLSFNQIIGLSALCFLEQVDQAIGKNHLFKRSVILIKAWCFYESRILGAHHGLISAYGLETLILYVINLFHASLDGPLMVLYRFLDFYSSFDWENYCVSVSGPIATSSLATIAEMHGIDGANLFLSKEFLDNCKASYSGPTSSSKSRTKGFPVKYLNIIDPLKDDNNLGRSVSKANFHRIKCALGYGAAKLGEILTLPASRVGEEIEKFFKHTIDRNGRGHRPDVQVPISAFGTQKFEAASLLGDYNTFYDNFMYSQWCQEGALLTDERPPPPHVQNCDRWDALHQVGFFNQNTLPQKGTQVFLPEPRCYRQNPFESFRRARGSSSHNHTKNHTQKRALEPMRSRQPEYSDRIFREMNNQNEATEAVQCDMSDWDTSLLEFPLVDTSPVEFPLVEVTERVHGESRKCLDASMEEFPLLASTVKSAESEVHPDPSLDKSPQVGDSNLPSNTITFGTFQATELQLGEQSSATSQRKVLGFMVRNSSERTSMTGIDKQVESLGSLSLNEAYELQDTQEFPPLSL